MVDWSVNVKNFSLVFSVFSQPINFKLEKLSGALNSMSNDMEKNKENLITLVGRLRRSLLWRGAEVHFRSRFFTLPSAQGEQ